MIDVSDVTLKTKRLILRTWKLSDVNDLFNYASINGVGEMAGWNHHKSKEESLMIIKMFIKEKNVFAIEYNNKVIGSIGIHKTILSEYPELNEKISYEIGYALSKEYWGNGIMPEACRTVINYLFKHYKIDAITCSYFHFNNQSKRVLEKLNFKHYREFIKKATNGNIYKTVGGYITKQDVQ